MDSPNEKDSSQRSSDWCVGVFLLILLTPFVALIVKFFMFLATYATAIDGGKFDCENLDKYHCAFAVSGGNRCVLVTDDGGSGFRCTTSEIVSDEFNYWREREACMEKCGLQRRTIGIPYAALFSSDQKLCSDECSDNCPNIVDYYSTLVMYFPKFCEAKREMARSESSARPPLMGR